MEQQPGPLTKLVDAWKRRGAIYVASYLLMSLTHPIWTRYPALVGRRREFAFQGRAHPYFWHRYNGTWANERSVEIPIVQQMIGRFNHDSMLEVGNVLSHYFSGVHDVVDKYEVARGVTNADVVDFAPGKCYELIVSISTLEHVGWDEYPREAGKAVRAIEHLRRCLREGGRLVVTLPVGHNDDLDRALAAGEVSFSERYYLKRESAHNAWVETDATAVEGARYDAPFPSANVLLVGVIERGV
jgi:SAM-dependent methyltransferase